MIESFSKLEAKLQEKQNSAKTEKTLFQKWKEWFSLSNRFPFERKTFEIDTAEYNDFSLNESFYDKDNNRYYLGWFKFGITKLIHKVTFKKYKKNDIIILNKSNVYTFEVESIKYCRKKWFMFWEPPSFVVLTICRR